MANKYTYVIDLNERGEFHAHVENKKGKIIYCFSNEEEGESCGVWLVSDGFMKHTKDVDGLQEYLIDMKIIPADSTLTLLDAHC